MGSPSKRARSKDSPAPEPQDSPTVELGRIFKSLTSVKNYGAAGDLLTNFSPQNRIEERIIIHYRAQLLTFQGQWSAALKQLEELQITHGAHLRVLSDIGRCRYMTGDLAGWRSTVQQLEQTFTALRDQISLDTYVRTGVTLAFFLEEEGRLGSAMDMYEDLLRKTRNPENSTFRLPALIRCVRLQSLAGGMLNLGRTYDELLRFADDEWTLENYVETQHALILAEVVLYGFEKAQDRLLSVLRANILKDKLTTPDRRLLYFDYLDLAVVHGAPQDGGIPLDVTPYADDVFETALLEVLDADAGFSLEKLDQWMVCLPFAGLLRVLTHLTRRLGDGPGQAVRDQFDLLLKVLDSRSQQMWRARLNRKN